ncbi:Fibropellin-1 like [Melia azedarach]|uniref:Fibropellin-1 like n=1 Tax=Melia azedarach TaxID=155640 RepID=A0ACC1X0M0_MELAZ|nr:Fibropellin-1 like [Melia azedarach]
MAKTSLLLFLLVLFLSMSHRLTVAEARPFSIIPSQQRYAKIFGTLGIVCKCCDNGENECTSTWTEPCSKLQCLPWKLH